VINHQFTPVNKISSTFVRSDLQLLDRRDLHIQDPLIDPIQAERYYDLRGILSKGFETLDVFSDLFANTSQSLPSDTPESLAVLQIALLSQPSP
jgi:hypothetical protein